MRKSNSSSKELWLFFGLTLGLTYLVFWGPLAVLGIPGASLAGASGPPWAIALYVIGGFTPSLVGIFLSWRQKTLRLMWKRLDPRTVNLRWHLSILGVVLLVPLIRVYLGGPGLSLLAGAIILGIMILPTVISISIDALEAVPRSYREGSMALGATTWQTVRMVVLKAARSGIVTAVILGMGRAIGETMAVIMVTGNALIIPHLLTDPIRTLTSNIALELAYASGPHQKALFATGVILFIMIMFLNIGATLTSRRR